MDEVKEFVDRALAFAASSNTQPSTLSRKLLGNGLRLSQLGAGKSLRVDTLERAKERLSEMEEASRRKAAA